MTRRILALLLSVMMILSLAPSAVFADDSGDAADGEPIIVATEEPAEEPAEEAEEPVLEPITDPLDDPFRETAETQAFSEEKIAVFFTDSKGWDGDGAIKVYYWKGEENNGWPGAGMTYLYDNGLGQSVYGALVPNDAAYVIFNQGDQGGNQTANITGIENGAWWYADNDNSGKFIENVFRDAKSVTCTEAGNTAYYQLDGHYYDTDLTSTTQEATVIPAAGHTLTHTEGKAATCTENGNIEYWYCSICNKYFSDADCSTETTLADTIIPASGHQYEDGVCTVCGAVDPDATVAKISDKPYATLEAAITAAQAGDTITLLKDVTVNTGSAASSRLAIGKSMTIDGAGHTISINNRGFGVGMNATEKIDVTFKDVTIENNTSGARCIDTRGNIGTLTLDHVTLNTQGATGYTQPLTVGGNQGDAATIIIRNNSLIQTNDDGTAYYAIITFNPVNMTIDHSTIKGWACIYAKPADSSAGSAGSVFTITNSNLISKNTYSGTSNAFGMLTAEDDNITFNITNTAINVEATGDQKQAIISTEKNNVTANLGEGNVVTLEGDNAVFALNNGKAVVSGGEFNKPVPEDCCAEGLVPTELANGKYSVKVDTSVALVGETKYETFAEAAAAANGAVITLLKDITEPYTLESGELKVKLDGHTLTVKAPNGSEAAASAPDADGVTTYAIDVEFSYTFDGKEVALSAILQEVGLTGTVTSARSDYETLLTVAQNGEDWKVSATKPYSSVEDVIVTISGIERVIHVTNTAEKTVWTELVDRKAPASTYAVIDETNKTVTVSDALGLAWVAYMTNTSNADWNWFDSWTVQLGADIDLTGYLWEPIGNAATFDGSFDGCNYTVSNLRQNVYQQTSDYVGDAWSVKSYYGLFGRFTGVSVKNLVMDHAEVFCEGGNIGAVAGGAWRNVTFENITVKNCHFNGYNYGVGCIVGWATGSTGGDYVMTFSHITVDSSNVLNPVYCAGDTPLACILGNQGVPTSGSFKTSYDNCDLSAQVMQINDCCMAYDYYGYRNAGMLIGRISGVEPGAEGFDASKYVIIGENVNVTYEDWNQGHYCEFQGVGLKAGAHIRLDGPDYHSWSETYERDGHTIVIADLDQHYHREGEHHDIILVFDQLIGAGTGGKGARHIEGVNITYKNTVNVNQFPIWTWSEDGKAVAQFDAEGTIVEVDPNPVDKDGKKIATVEYDGDIYIATLDLVTVTFETNGGSEVPARQAVVGQTIEAPATNPTKEHYTFVRWCSDAELTTEFDFTQPITEDVTAYAQWLGDPATVIYMDWNGTILQQISTRFGEKTPAFEGTLPTREGYSLNEANLWMPALAEMVESATVIYQLNWVKQHVVTFDSDGGSAVEAQQVDDGALATRPADPTKEGYTFLGWFDGNNEFNFETKKIYEDYTLKAHWKINQYTVKFMDGETVLQKTTADYGTAITAPEVTPREGYFFKGWDVTVPATIPAQDLTINAVWGKAVAKVTDSENNEVIYESLQEAVDAARTQVNGTVTVTLLTETTENVKYVQKRGLNLVITGENMPVLNGQIMIFGGGFFDIDSVTIEGIKFVQSDTMDDTFIYLAAKEKFNMAPYVSQVEGTIGHSDAHNITVKNCEFVGTDDSKPVFKAASDTQANTVVLSGLKATGVHSLGQFTGTKYITIENCDVAAHNGININGDCETVTIENNKLVTDGYALRMKEATAANKLIVTLSGNDFVGATEGSDGVFIVKTGTLNVESGNYKGLFQITESTKEKMNITGGFFTEIPLLAYCGKDADGNQLYPMASDRDDEYKYTVDLPVAAVKDFGYPSVAEAKAARDTIDDVITLLKNADYAFVAGDVLKIYKANDTIEFTYTVPETYVLTISDPDDNGVVTYTVVGSVAKIEREGETLYFASLADAVAAAVEGDTITMIADSTEANQSINIANKNFTLDLNGKVVTLPAGDGFTGSNATVVFMDSSDTEKNGTGTGKLAHTGAYDIADVTNATFTVESGTYEAGKYGVFYLRGNSNLTVNGGNLSTNGTGLNVLGNSTITINGGTIHGNNTGLYLAGTAKGEMNGGEISGLYGLVLMNTAEFIMNDGTIKATGYCVSSNFHSDLGFTFTMKGGQLFQTDKDQPAIYMPGIGTVNIEGGYIEGKYAVKMMHGVLNISGGTLVGLSENAVEINSRCWGANDLRSDADRANYSQTPEVSITGGYFIGGEGYDAIEVNQGTNTHQTTGETVVGGIVEHFISDGHYSTEPAAKYIVPDKAAYQAEEDGTIWWVIGDAVASIDRDGETLYYISLAAAIAAVQDGETIVLLKDVTENTIVDGGKNFTLDLNEKTLTGAIDQYDANITITNGTVKGTIYSNGLAAGKSGSLAIAANAVIESDYAIILWQANDKTGNGQTININGTVNGIVWVMGNIVSGNSVINVNSGAKIKGDDVGLALNGYATVNVYDGASIEGTATGIEVRAGKLNVAGGTIKGDGAFGYTPNGSGTTTVGAAIAVAQHNTKLDVEVSITGGTLVADTDNGGKLIAVTDAQENGLDKVEVEAKDIFVVGTETKLPDGFAWGKKAGTTDMYEIVTAVAKIGDQYFATLADAVAAAEANDTIEMIADSNETSAIVIDDGKSITVDLAGHSVTGRYIDLYSGFLTITDTAETKGSFGNLVYVNVGADESKAAGEYNSFTLAEGAVMNNNVYVYQNNTAKGYGSKVTVSGTMNGLIFVLGNIHEGNSVVDVYGTINSPDDVGIALNGYAIVNVYEGASIEAKDETGNGTGIEVRAGELNVTGGTIKGNGEPTEVNPNGSGTTSTGAGIAISQHSTKLPIKVNISGGEISGYTALYESNPQNNSEEDLAKIEVSITGGDFIAKDNGTVAVYSEDLTAFISDGRYSTEPDPTYIVPSKAAYKEGEWWLIGDAVAQIGTIGYATLEAAFATAVDGDTIKVLKDCAGNGIKVPQGKFTTGLTVDFDGHTYTMDGAMVGSTGTETQAFQLLKDNKITFKNGTITSEKAKILVQNYSNLTLDNMTLTLDNASYASAYTLSNNNGNITIKDTTINANPAGGFAFDVCRYASYPSVSVTVTGSSTITGNIEISASGSDAKDGFRLMLESGTFNGAIVLDATAAAAMAATPEKAWIKKVDANVADDGVGIPKDYKWVEEGEGKSRLTPKDYVAENVTTGEKYETLEEAVAEAKDGETVKLLKDCAGNGIKVPQGKFTTGLTVDFAGFTYDFSGKGVGSAGTEYNGFQLLKDNKITFTNGTIKATSEDAGFLIQNYSNLTLHGMTIDGTGVWGGYVLSNNNGSVVIKDSTITAKDGDFAFDVCRYASYPSVSVTVTGSSVINGNIEVSASGSDAKDGFRLMLESGTFNGAIVLDATAAAAMAATPEKAWIKKVDANVADDGVGIPKYYKWVEEGEGKSRLTPKDYVAENVTTGEKYETLEEAVAEAKDGETVKLLKDCAGNGIKVPQGKFTTGLTVDFAGFTYDFSGKGVGSAGTENNGFQLLKDNKITFRNGTIKATSEDAGFLIQNYSNLTLDGMTIDGTGVWGGYVLSNNNGNVVIRDTTITAKDGDFAFDVCRYASYPSVSVTVTGNSTITGNIEIYASGKDAKDGLSLMLEGGTFNGEIKLAPSGADVIETNPEKAFVKKTNANVADDAIGIPDGYMWRDNNDGTSTLVPAVVVTFVTETGIEAPAAQTIEKGTKAEKPADPVKEHYNFLGWFAEGADEAFDFNTAITESITLTAKFEGEPITILYVNEDGTILQKFVVHYNDTVDAYTFTAFDNIVVPQGYKYYTDDMWTETVKSPATEDAVYVLKLVEGLSVTFNPDNGQDAWTVNVDAKDTVARPATDPTREGYFFMGWYNGNNAYDFNTPVTASITLTAKWEAYEYEITYVWEDDNTTVTATARCTNAAEYGVTVPDVTETVNTTKAVTKDPTGDENGEITYTAEFTNELFETQTKVVKTAKLPKAKVEEIESKENVKLYTMPGMNETTNVVDKIEAEYLFTALPADADTLETYGDWNCDYRITFDSRITKETFGLYGAYGDYSVAFKYPTDLAQDESVYLLSSIGQLTYNEVYHNVSPFDCGVFNLSEDNIGKTITVELVIWQGDDKANAIVLTTTSYTFGEVVAHVLCVHDWNEPTYEWAADNSTVTATRVCKHDDTHIETETVDTTAVTTAATCEENGQTVYTATFENEAFETQTKTVVLDAIGHDWAFVNFTWTETADGYTAVANYKCKNDESHTKTENATVKSEKTDATCEAAGQIVYTATEGDHTDTKTVEIEAIGHDWEFVDFTWTETADGYTAAANYKCKNDESHTTTVDATVVKTEQAAALGVDGAIVYTATVTAEASVDGEEHTDTKTIVIPGFPQAKVEDVTPVKEDVVLYSRETLEPTGDVVDQLEAEFAFTALEISNETYQYYKNWNCDYRVTFNADFAAESFGMYGEYSGWGKDFEVGFLYPNAVHMGDSIYLLNSVQPGLVQYKDVYDVIKTFYCGVFNLSEQNIGKSITVDLVIWQGDNTDDAIVITSTTYTFKGLSHIWEFVDFSWTETADGYTAVANYKCKADERHTATVDAAVTSVTTVATCEEAGKTVYTATVTADNSLDYAEHSDTKEVTIEAIGHDWDEVTYVWADDNSTVTATRVCKNDATHKETETVNTTSEVTKPATCEAKGETTYTATFENEAFETQTKEVENVDALGHDWGEPTYEWAADNSTVTATRVCKNDSTHVETETVNTTSAVTTPATCETAGKTTYTATFTNEAFETQTKTVEDVDAIGHDWGEPTYEWAADNSTVTATRVCKNDASHKETETVNTTSEVTKQATATENGEITYTAAFENEAFETQTKVVAIPSLPLAKVEEITQAKEDVALYTMPGMTPTGETLDKLGAEYLFTALEVEQDTYDYYKNWHCDYRIRFNDDINADTFGLYGAYTGFGNTYEIGFRYPANLAENESVYLLQSAGLDNVTYADIYDIIKTFDCGVFNLDNENVGKKITVELVIWEGDDADDAIVLTSTTYKFKELSHIWKFVDFTWTETADGWTAVANYVCTYDATHTTTLDAVVTSVTTDATCEDTGKTVYTATVTADNSLDYAEHSDTKEVAIEAIGHDWDEVTYVWADDNSTVTATRVCKNDATHKETETVNTTSEVTKPATCEEKGETTYTATFTNEAFETQTKTLENVDALGHDWGEPTYEWAADNSTVTATRVCKNDSTHVETETVNTTETVITAATCEEKGESTFTATFTNEAFKPQTKTVATDEIGHAYGEPTYTWSDDNSTCTGEMVCANDESHKITREVTATFGTVTPATCEETGEGMYVAIFVDPFRTQIKTVEIPAIGHDWAFVDFTWTETTDGYTAVANYVCNNDNTHTKQVDATVTKTQDSNYTTYTATVTADVSPDGLERTEEKKVPLEPAFMTQALALEGQIGVYFYLRLPQVDGYEYEGVNFTISSTDGADAFVPFSPDMPTNSKGYYRFTYYVRSIEMADTITATLKYKLNGEAKTLVKTYSVKQYIETFDNYTSLFSELEQAMTKATADYGHYVQAFLETTRTWVIGVDYAEMDKYYTDYTADDISAAQTGLADYVTAKTVGSNMEKITYTLVLDSDTELRVYFKPAADYTGTFTFTMNGETITEDGEKISVKLQSDGRYMVSIKNIAAHELARVYEIKAVGDGVESTMTVSALSYVNAIMTAYAGNEKAINAAVAIYRYAMAAKALRPGA